MMDNIENIQPHDDRGSDFESLTAYSEWAQNDDAAMLDIAPVDDKKHELPANILSPDFIDHSKDIPKRQIITKGIMRGYVSVTVGAGGVGKSLISTLSAVAVAVGTPLTGSPINEQVPVLILNNEDDQNEIDRRIAGILLHHNIQPSHYKDRIHTLSGYGRPIMIAQRIDRDIVAATHDYESLHAYIVKHKIGVLLIDPFISIHDVEENNNTAIDKVVQQLKRLAHDTRVAVVVIHHTRKAGGDSEIIAGDAESGRGASSLKDAARSLSTVTRMGPATADKIGFNDEERARHSRVDIGKMNFGLADRNATWFRMESVKLPNGDSVGVPALADLSSLFAKSKSDVKWTATTVADALEKIWPKSKSVIQFTDIRELFRNANKIGTTQANNIITLVSQDSANPTRIRANYYVDYWVTKEAQKSPWTIHRQEISE